MHSHLLVVIAAVLLSAGSRAQNLLQNGSFEDPDIVAGNSDVFLDPFFPPGWTETTFCGMELQDHCCGSPSDGEQHVELDSTCSSTIGQTVTTQPGAKYVLSFDFSPRPGVDINSAAVTWNGAVIFTPEESGFGLEDSHWTHYSGVVTATGTTSTVEFSDTTAPFQPGAGTFIDNVPEPARSAQLLAGLCMIAALARKSHSGVGPR